MAKFCAECGAPMQEGHSFCEYCGAAAVNAVPPASGVAGAAGVAGAGFGGYQPPQAPQPSQYYHSYEVPNPKAQVVDNKSALTRAWEDFSSEKGIVGKMALLALVAMVPVLNFFAFAFLARWAVDAAADRREGMPKNILEDFTLGCYIFVVELVYGLVLGVLGNIPLVGLVAAIFLAPFLSLCVIRTGLYHMLGSGFELSKVWDLYRSRMGDIMVSYLIPTVIGVVAVSVVAFIVGIAGGVSLVGLQSGNVVGAGVGLVVGLVTFVGVYVMLCALMVVSMVAYRALGYVVADAAPEWIQEARAVNPNLR